MEAQAVRPYAIALSRYLACAAVLVGVLDLSVHAPWWGPASSAAAAVWFAALSVWISRSQPKALAAEEPRDTPEPEDARPDGWGLP
jgi:hypothetical protein